MHSKRLNSTWVSEKDVGQIIREFRTCKDPAAKAKLLDSLFIKLYPLIVRTERGGEELPRFMQ